MTRDPRVRRWAGVVALVGVMMVPAVGWGAGAALTGEEARKKFVAVETFARLANEEQVKGLGDFYRGATLNGVSLMILSSYPGNILDRQNGNYAGGKDVWGEQLKDAAGKMTVEEVADNLGMALWWNVGTYVRTRQVLQAQEKEVARLVGADLEATDVGAFGRGCNVVQELKLTGFTGKILDVYIAGGAREKAAYTALVWLGDPEIAVRLRAEVEKDPKTLKRHAGLFQGPLGGKAADPLLVKYLSSEDPEMRYAAASALVECVDAGLAEAIGKLAKDEAVRTQERAMLMAQKLPQGAFETVRGELMPLLRSKEANVQNGAIKAFADHKDMAVAGVIREFLVTVPEKAGGGYNVTVMQGLVALTGENFGYSPVYWGPERNAGAIAKFDAWVRARNVPVEEGMP